MAPTSEHGIEPEGAERAAAPGRVDRWRAALTTRFERARSRSAVVDGLAATWSHDSEVGGGVMSGALAFRLFLFLVPLVLLFFTAFGTAAEVADRSAEEMATSAGISGLLAKGVVNAGSMSTGQKWTILVVAGYATFTASRSVVKTLVDAVCLAWKMPRVRLRRTKPALVFIAYFTLATWLTSELGRLRAAAPAPGVTLTVAWLVVPFLSIWWLMARLPHRNAPTWALIPGAVLTAIGFQVMHIVTVAWIAPSMANRTETYGVIGVSLTVLLWCYLVGRLVIGSTVLNAALWRRYESRHPEIVSSELEPTSWGARIRQSVSAAIDLLR